MKLKNKLRPLWVVLSIENCQPANHFLVSVEGVITESNFLDTGPIKLPGIRAALEDITTYDTVRITWFTLSNKVRPDNDMTLALADQGIKYERLGADGWELLYEDMEVL